MAKQIDTLVEDIYGIFNSDQKFDLSLFDKFGSNVRDLMDVRFHQKYEGDPYLRMSNIGRPDRQLWYDINSPKEDREILTPQTLVKFSYGDLIEQMILLYAKMAGHEVTDEQAEVEVDGIKGHIDAVVDGVVVDVKSASSFSFQKFESGALFQPGNDPFGYVAQLCGYIEATGLKRGGFLAVDKTLGKICFCEIPAEVIAKYRVKDRIEHIKQVVQQPEPPERCYAPVPEGKSGNMKLDTGCSYCQHKFKCWPNLKTYYYSNGPKYLTRVVKEPRVSEFPSEIQE